MNKWKPFKSAGEVIHKIGSQKFPELSKHYALYQEALSEQSGSSKSMKTPFYVQRRETATLLMNALQFNDNKTPSKPIEKDDYTDKDPETARIHRVELSRTLNSIFEPLALHVQSSYYDFLEDGENRGYKGEQLEEYIQSQTEFYAESLLTYNSELFLDQDDKDYQRKVDIIREYKEEILAAPSDNTNDYFYLVVKKKNPMNARKFSKSTYEEKIRIELRKRESAKQYEAEAEQEEEY